MCQGDTALNREPAGWKASMANLSKLEKRPQASERGLQQVASPVKRYFPFALSFLPTPTLLEESGFAGLEPRRYLRVSSKSQVPDGYGLNCVP